MPDIIVLQPDAASVAANKATSPSGALVRAAGMFSVAIAKLYPRPHAAYFAAEPARQRAMQMLAHRYNSAPSRALAEALRDWSLKRVFADYFPEAPAGLVEALKKIQGEPWRPDEHQRLIDLLREGGPGAKALHHAAAIDRELVRVLAALPAPLRRARIVAHLPTGALADLAGRAAKRVVAIHGADALARLGDRLERARSTHNLFRMLIDEIGLEQLAPPPVPGADWFKPIATTHALRSAALRFENCLETRLGWLLSGRGAYYEVLGDEPAIVEIMRASNGLWIAGEIRGHANAVVSKALMQRVVTHLARHGAVTPGMKIDRLALQLADIAGL